MTEATAALAIHPSAVVAPGVHLGEGVRIAAFCHVETGALLGPGVVLQSGVRIGEDAVVGAGCHVGPGAVVGARVALGEDCVIGANAVLLGPSRLGKRCRVHAFAVVGDEPQDRSWHGEESRLEVGDDVVVREHVTLHRGTAKGGGVTRVGSRCLLMVGVHVAHDCVVGDDVQLANLTTLGGHVVLGDHVVCGGHVAFAPFVRVGRGAYLAGGAMVERDVPPFMITAGDRARVRAPNRIGLERLGLSEESQRALVDTFRLTYGSGAPLVQGIAKARALYGSDPHVQELLAFIEPAGD